MTEKRVLSGRAIAVALLISAAVALMGERSRAQAENPAPSATESRARADGHVGGKGDTEAGHEAGHEGHGSGHAAEHEAHAPGWDVGLQAINFGLFALLIVYLARHKVREFFHGREASFRQAQLRADHAKKDAEGKKREIQDRLSSLDASAEASVAQARSEADALRARMLAEAEALRSGLRDEAERSTRVELERAKAELRAEMIAQAMRMAKDTLTEKIAETDQKRLQTEFVEKIQVVRP
jgi:F-type H+-transporting ATPase subunit b